MFDLEQAITEWRRQMLAAGIRTPALLDELEGHLRDDMDTQISGGAMMREAFESAVACIGQATLLWSEFAKVGGPGAGRERVKDAFLTLAGIPHSPLETDMIAMTANPNPEPCWATYTKAAVFLAPAIGLWSFCVLFFVPKLQRICQDSGLAVPPVCRAPWIIANHTFAICAAPVLVLILLEWRWSQWPRYRRVSLGGVVFFLNAGVIALITLMVLLALLAAPALMHHAP
jgi:hypothetical protein